MVLQGRAQQVDGVRRRVQLPALDTHIQHQVGRGLWQARGPPVEPRQPRSWPRGRVVVERVEFQRQTAQLLHFSTQLRDRLQGHGSGQSEPQGWLTLEYFWTRLTIVQLIYPRTERNP